MDHEMVEAEWYLAESDESDADAVYVEPSGMVETAVRELGAVIVAVEVELPEPARA
jgi:hypothetical protein